MNIADRSTQPPDDALLRRFREGPWSELTEEEVFALVERARTLPSVRAELLARWRLEQALIAHWEEAAPTAEGFRLALRPSRKKRWLGVAGVALLGLAGLATFLIWPVRTPVPPEKEARPTLVTARGDAALEGKAEATQAARPVAVEAPRPEGVSPVVEPEPMEVVERPAHWVEFASTRLRRELATIGTIMEPRALWGLRAFEAGDWDWRNRWGNSWGRMAADIDRVVATFTPDLPLLLESHPLATAPGREGEILSRELRRALETEALADAAELIPAISDIAGLIPSLDDAARWIPPDTLVHEALAHPGLAHAGLAHAMETHWGSSAQQAVRQAMTQEDHALIEQLAVRFAGTNASGEAQLWLGDRAMALGEWETAEVAYRRALAQVPEDAGEENAPGGDARRAGQSRLALVLAMRGMAAPGTGAGEAAEEDSEVPVLEGSGLTEEEWGKLLEKQRELHAVTSTEVTGPALPEPGAYRFTPRFRVAGNVGRDPQKILTPEVDWAGRQLSVSQVGRFLYFSNRFQVGAFDMQEGRTSWTVGLEMDQGDAHSWPNIAFQPMIQGQRVIVRRLLGRGPELAALPTREAEAAVWRSASDLIIVSEPWLENGSLWAITGPRSRQGGRPVDVALTQFRPTDGLPLGQTPLMVFDPSVSRFLDVQIARVREGFCLQTRGVAAFFDHAGRARWLRRLPFVPLTIDRHLDQVAIVPPTIVGDRVYFSLADARQVLCCDLATGKKLWVRAADRLGRLITATERVVVMRVDSRLMGLDAASGVVAWEQRVAGLTDAALADDRTLLVVARGESGGVLHWFDLATGQTRGEGALGGSEEAIRQAGPYFHDGTQWNLFLGSEDVSGGRVFGGLSPEGDGES